MEAIIKKVVVLEQQAKDMVKAVRDRQAKIDEEIAKDIHEIDSFIEDRMNNRIRQLHEMEEQEAARRVAEIANSAEVSLQKIREKYSQNRSAWETNLFQKIVGR